MRTFLARAAVLAVSVLAAPAGLGRALADTACYDDAARLCPGIPANDPQTWACLLRNELQLSAGCVQNINELRRRVSELHADCAADAYRFCPGTQPGGGRVLDCLRLHVGRRELSSNCEESVVTALEKVNDFSVKCGGDMAALCQGVEVGGGRMYLCLRAQYERLSSRCKEAISP